jgi:hypothetical protein
MSKPAWTKNVQQGMWLIVARSATVWTAEQGGLPKEERDLVLTALRYAMHHWAPAEVREKFSTPNNERETNDGQVGVHN